MLLWKGGSLDMSTKLTLFLSPRFKDHKLLENTDPLVFATPSAKSSQKLLLLS